MFIQPASSLSQLLVYQQTPKWGRTCDVAETEWSKFVEIFFLIQNNSYKSHEILETYLKKEKKTTPLNIYTGAREY